MLKSKGITNFVSEKVKVYYQINKKLTHTHIHTQRHIIKQNVTKKKID